MRRHPTDVCPQNITHLMTFTMTLAKMDLHVSCCLSPHSGAKKRLGSLSCVCFDAALATSREPELALNGVEGLSFQDSRILRENCSPKHNRYILQSRLIEGGLDVHAGDVVFVATLSSLSPSVFLPLPVFLSIITWGRIQAPPLLPRATACSPQVLSFPDAPQTKSRTTSTSPTRAQPPRNF